MTRRERTAFEIMLRAFEGGRLANLIDVVSKARSPGLFASRQSFEKAQESLDYVSGALELLRKK